eukprot:TRINITY_DN18321_c0_g1::TRINITY_DN18321_c0_g1_i1::g.3862::m.3862 TRINITY_DN18321_c0_g1::TRINITY_DN18321_c0_g1_i1::g.3862  ORF type:complete len:174 (+),score=0.90,YPEB/PF14620.1/0.0016,zf-C4pol/PF14260.1/2e+03,zf-C4pol/PF14260.1/0.27,TMEM247/PF15444.1/0.77 TRINITY_DN18321_c0_g1_i1:2-523(+)
MEAYRMQMANYLKESQNQILVYNSILAEKQKSLEKLRMDLANYELERQKKEDSELERTRQLGEIRMAIENIYQRSKVRRQAESNSPISLLNAIEERMQDYHEICFVCKSKLKEQQQLPAYSQGQSISKQSIPKAEKSKLGSGSKPPQPSTITKAASAIGGDISLPPSSRTTSR